MKFKVGDIVTTAPDMNGLLLEQGKLYKITRIDPTSTITAITVSICLGKGVRLIGFEEERFRKIDENKLSKVERLLLFE